MGRAKNIVSRTTQRVFLTESAFLIRLAMAFLTFLFWSFFFPCAGPTGQCYLIAVLPLV